jgi:hypothetical protein
VIRQRPEFLVSFTALRIAPAALSQSKFNQQAIIAGEFFSVRESLGAEFVFRQPKINQLGRNSLKERMKSSTPLWPFLVKLRY